MLSNKHNDARILVEDVLWRECFILPGYKTIRPATAKSIIKELELSFIPGYKDYPSHNIGSSVFVFSENVKKY